MKTVNMHEAKTHLSKLVAEAVAGEPFLIAKAGKPLVKVMPIEEKPRVRRLGILEGQMSVPENFFDPKLDDEIAELFHQPDPLLEEALEALAKHQAAEKAAEKERS